MKLSKLALASVAAALLLSLSLQAKNEARKAYIFGFASSFNDSTVYFTDIQELDSAWFTSKNKFLVSRENYSYQLRDYLSNQGDEHRTCMVEYSCDAKKIEKAWNKLHARYEQNQKKKNNQKQTSELPPFQIKHLTRDQFTFQAVEPLETEVQEEETSKKNAPKDKGGMKPPKDGERPPMGGMQGGGMPMGGANGNMPMRP